MIVGPGRPRPLFSVSRRVGTLSETDAALVTVGAKVEVRLLPINPRDQ